MQRACDDNIFFFRDPATAYWLVCGPRTQPPHAQRLDTEPNHPHAQPTPVRHRTQPLHAQPRSGREPNVRMLNLHGDTQSGHTFRSTLGHTGRQTVHRKALALSYMLVA
eukprot:364507-Chlamydomonas_euryale.AAC.7